MKKFTSIFLCCSLFLCACDAYLDIKPKGYTIPEYYDDYRRLMNDAQIMGKASDSYPNVMTDDALYADGNIPYNLDEMNDNTKFLYRFDHGPIFNQGTTDNLWEYAYNRLYYCNTVILNIMNVKDAPEEDKLNLKAEALVARAFEYLILIGAYAPAYDAATAAKDWGVPIITSLDMGNTTYRRNTVAEVYKAIEEDLAAAVPHLLDVVPNSFRPAKSVAYGFLARMYLMMRNYDKALENAVSALGINDQLVDLKLYTIKSPTTSIGRIVLESDKITPYPEGMNNPENIYVRYAPSVFALNGYIYASRDLLDTYARDIAPGAEDLRRSFWFVDDVNAWGEEFPGYSQWFQYTRANLGLNNMEMVLTAAECYARKGDAASLAEASRLYNYLRDHRIKNNVHVHFSTREEGVRKVLDERRREFPFLGTYRLVDLKRLNKEPEFQKTVVHTYNGKTYTLPPNDSRYIFPIPPKVKAFRPDLPDYER